jgi:hypothetical protein
MRRIAEPQHELLQLGGSDLKVLDKLHEIAPIGNGKLFVKNDRGWLS